MRTMKIESVHDSKQFMFISKDKNNPAICVVDNINFHDTESFINCKFDIVNKGRYSKGKLKKMVARTIVSILRRIISEQKSLFKHIEEKND